MHRWCSTLLCTWLLGCSGTDQRTENDPFIPGLTPLQGIQLELPKLGGGTCSLSSLRGKPVLLFLFTTWSLRCQAEAPLLVRLYETYHPQGLEVKGIAVEQLKPELIRAYADYVGYKFDILLSLPDDPLLVGAFGQTFHVPRTLLLDRDGHKVLDLKGQTDFAVVESKVKDLLPSVSAERKRQVAAEVQVFSPKDQILSKTKKDPSMILTVKNFDTIKSFIIKKGDRSTFCSMYNHNPHYRFEGFDVYLIPDVGQKNINCDPTISDFNELIIQDQRKDRIYYKVKRNPKKPRLVFKSSDEEKLNQYFEQMKSLVD